MFSADYTDYADKEFRGGRPRYISKKGGREPASKGELGLITQVLSPAKAGSVLKGR